MYEDKQILIVDDHLLFADGLQLILGRLGIIRVDISSEVQSQLADVSQLAQYDLVIMDLNMPGLNGFSFLKAIRSQRLSLRVVVISGTENQSDIERAIALGAVGYIPKDSSTKEMLLGVETVLNGQRYLPAKWSDQINWLRDDSADTSTNVGKLGKRQLEVLTMMRDGLRNKQIALVLGITESTVKSHVEILFRELHAQNRTACVLEGIRQGLIDERPQQA